MGSIMADRHITRLKVRNFQKYADAEFTFGPGLNAIVGASDRGKSTILRAIGWLALHKPTSKDYIRFGQKSVAVGLEFSDGSNVIRYKDAESGYKTPTGEWKAVRQQPPEVESILRLTEANFQRQRDPYYMISLSPGDMAKEINKIIDLEAIDSVATWIKSALSDTDGSLRSLNEWIEQKETRVNALEWVEGAVEYLGQINTLEERRKSLNIDLPRIAQIISEVRQSQMKIADMSEMIELLSAFNQEYTDLELEATRVWAAVSGIRDCVSAYKASRNQLPKLEEIISALSEREKDIVAIKETEKSLGILRSDVTTLKGVIQGTKKDFEKISLLELFLGDMRVIIDHVTQAKTKRDAISLLSKLIVDHSTARQSKERWDEKTKQIAKVLGELCPTCGRPLHSKGEHDG